MNTKARRGIGLVVASGWAVLAVSSATAYELARSTVDGGGSVRSFSPKYELSGTIGQYDTGGMSGGGFALTGGFWFGEPPGDCDATGTVDSFDYEEFFDCQSGPGASFSDPACNCLDLDNDGDVDLIDFAEFTVLFEG